MVNCNEEDTYGRAKVTTEEERVLHVELTGCAGNQIG